MKKNLFLLIPALAMVFFLSSCSKDDTTTTATPEGTWAGTCGTGKDKHEITFSPALGQIVETKHFNYLPNGFINVARAVKMVSLD